MSHLFCFLIGAILAAWITHNNKPKDNTSEHINLLNQLRKRAFDRTGMYNAKTSEWFYLRASFHALTLAKLAIEQGTVDISIDDGRRISTIPLKKGYRGTPLDYKSVNTTILY